MIPIGKVVERAVKSEIKIQLGLVYSDMKVLKEDLKDLKQKYFDLKKKIRKAEIERQENTDFGV